VTGVVPDEGLAALAVALVSRLPRRATLRMLTRDGA